MKITEIRFRESVPVPQSSGKTKHVDHVGERDDLDLKLGIDGNWVILMCGDVTSWVPRESVKWILWKADEPKKSSGRASKKASATG